jgi:hypothetical protein
LRKNDKDEREREGERERERLYAYRFEEIGRIVNRQALRKQSYRGGERESELYER